MIKRPLLAALPLAFTVAACGEPLDGSDTADLGADATEPEATTSEYEPGEDGLLQDDVIPDDMEAVDESDAAASDPMIDDGV